MGEYNCANLGIPMVKFLKPGKVVIVKFFPEGSKKRQFHHCLVVGLSKPPKALKKKMNEKQQRRANSVRPFCKHVNVRHLMPTRYMLDNYQDLSPTWVLNDDNN